MPRRLTKAESIRVFAFARADEWLMKPDQPRVDAGFLDTLQTEIPPEGRLMVGVDIHPE
ncbi:hypothetical protein BQ8482_111635 [Mesorhizobium delmotii]|uniref:Uncharacterized protein n=1 Tax=Mesorhizobium delmotii TaxID=1631247 RepID=A0A2P9AF15_9HYPH|nr:hypothetical protein BQ8482_111635 [Mesorhizobium delmotii]